MLKGGDNAISEGENLHNLLSLLNIIHFFMEAGSGGKFFWSPRYIGRQYFEIICLTIAFGTFIHDWAHTRLRIKWLISCNVTSKLM